MQATLSCRATIPAFGGNSEQIDYDSYLAEYMTGMEKIPRGVITWVSILILLGLASSCSTRKTTSPVEPTVYVIKDYFPLNDGDEWIWEAAVVKDSAPEPFVDGDVNLGEPFVDVNENGIYEPTIDYFDSTMALNNTGAYDGPDDAWTAGIPYWDRNNNGEFDYPNGQYDQGELFSDLDANGIWNWILSFHAGRLKAEIDSAISWSSDESMICTRRSGFLEWDGDSADHQTEDGFSNDSLGLRWHSHAGYWFHWESADLSDHGPIIIAKSETKIGDVVVCADTSYYEDQIEHIWNWTSIFETVEDVSVPAGNFPDCLKFKTVVSGWTGNMARYNGTSYQWYAKDVGLVKSEGPRTGEFWQLESAIIGGQGYP